MSRGSGPTCPRLRSLLAALCLMIGCAAAASRASRLLPVASALDVLTGLGQQPSSNKANASASAPAIGHGDEEGEEEDEQQRQQQQQPNGTMRCDDARLRCAYRTGCGRALQHYLTRCAAVLHGDANDCPEDCQHALIGLASTDEGKELMTCYCQPDDILCKLSKQRVEICRASVTTTMKRPRVSCRVASWICNADALCSTALQYYNENCKRMFHGKKCTKRCRNSINILRRQEKAAKLNTCFCDGAEEYDCIAIHRNMDVLCFNKPSQHHNYQEHQLGADSSASNASSSYDYAGGYDPSETNKLANGAAAAAAAATTTTSGRSASCWRILLLGLLLLLLLPSAAG